MTVQPVVLKFGGEALASPERIVAAARRVARRAERQPVVVVASARRGVTDHLLDLVRAVGQSPGLAPEPGTGARSAADRAVASGELVSSSLLALALEHLGVTAAVLDAREAGIRSDGRFGDATLRKVEAGRIGRLLDRGRVPVVAGFQGWHRGRITTLGRGGSDITAVALASSLAAERCEFIKDAAGLMTADPKLVPDALLIRAASHRFATRLAECGARVLHPVAARAAEHHGVRLAFLPLEGDEVRSLVGGPRSVEGARAVALRPAGDLDEVSAVSDDEADTDEHLRLLTRRLAEHHLEISETVGNADGFSVRVARGAGRTVLQLLHGSFVIRPLSALSEAS